MAAIVVNPFHDVFTRMGFNPATRDVLIEQGYETMAMFAGLDDEQIREMIRTMTRRFQDNPNVQCCIQDACCQQSQSCCVLDSGAYPAGFPIVTRYDSSR
jgi:hypothetical protein